MAGSTSDVQNPFECSICLDLFKDPVTTSCGHSFCMKCIEDFWAQESGKQVFSCPTCRKTFKPRPDLSRCIVLAGILEEMKKDVPARPGDVQCDVCKGRKFKAVKSCLVCLASFCHTHVQPHHESKALKKHKLVSSSANLQQYICPQHHKALEIYCCDDQKCICVHCMGQHRGHKTVSAAIEMAEKKDELKIKSIHFDQQITGIKKNLQTFRKAAESHKRSAEEALDHTDWIFNELFQSLKKRQTKLKTEIRAQEKRETKQINDFIQKWEKEISSLQIQNNNLGHILHTENHVHFFQNYSSHSLTPCTKEVNDLTTFKKVKQSLSEVKSQMDDLCEEHMDKISKELLMST